MGNKLKIFESGNEEPYDIEKIVLDFIKNESGKPQDFLRKFYTTVKNNKYLKYKIFFNCCVCNKKILKFVGKKTSDYHDLFPSIQKIYSHIRMGKTIDVKYVTGYKIETNAGYGDSILCKEITKNISYPLGKFVCDVCKQNKLEEIYTDEYKEKLTSEKIECENKVIFLREQQKINNEQKSLIQTAIQNMMPNITKKIIDTLKYKIEPCPFCGQYIFSYTTTNNNSEIFFRLMLENCCEIFEEYFEKYCWDTLYNYGTKEWLINEWNSFCKNIKNRNENEN